MVQVGTVALDGTKLAGNAAHKANRTHDKLRAEVAEILRQAAEIDQREDRLFGEARGDELPPELAGKADRLARLRQAKAQLEAEAAAREQAYQQRVAAHTAAAAAKGQTPRTLKRRPQETPTPGDRQRHPPRQPLPAHPYRQCAGLQRQAVTTLEQVIVAAELTDEANDVHQLQPMLEATATTLAAAGIDQRPEAALADSGYWSIDNLTTISDAPELLIPPAKHGRQGKPREDGKARYAKRRETVEPAFGQIKEHQGARRFLRRGMRACNAEWKLCAAPITCSSCGGTRSPSQRPAQPPPERPPGRVTGAAASAIGQPPEPSPEASERPGTVSDMEAHPFRNGLLSVKAAVLGGGRLEGAAAAAAQHRRLRQRGTGCPDAPAATADRGQQVVGAAAAATLFGAAPQHQRPRQVLDHRGVGRLGLGRNRRRGPTAAASGGHGQAQLAGQGGVAAVVVAALAAGVLHSAGGRQAVGSLVQQRAQHLDRPGGQALPAHEQLGPLGAGHRPAPLREVAKGQLTAAADTAGGHRHDHLGHLWM